MPLTIEAEIERRERALTASVAPLAPPRSWFEMPEPNEPTPLTFTADGQAFGHLALWGTCHTGFLNGALNECVKPPRSESGYQFFHVGVIETAEGGTIPIGKLTFDTSHAPLTADLSAAARHYDHTGSVGAFIRARDGKHGIWASGALRSDLSPEGLRDLRANPPSGDWRSLRHSLEMVAALAVPVPGFPIPRAQLALAASAAGEQEISALILPAWSPDEILRSDRDSKSYIRQRETLLASMTR